LKIIGYIQALEKFCRFFKDNPAGILSRVPGFKKTREFTGPPGLIFSALTGFLFPFRVSIDKISFSDYF